MPKVSLKTMDELKAVVSPEVYSGPSSSRAYFDSDQTSLHLYLHELTAGDKLSIGCSDIDRLAYVWKGRVQVNGVGLDAGSSLIVERGRTLEIANDEEDSLVLTFNAASPSMHPAEGGNVHLLPAEAVPRCETQNGLKGGMHADSDCPTCDLWLHENHFPKNQVVSPENAAKGIHAHSEDEIIFVTKGEIHFGTKTGGPGTALFIAADTFYSFTPGPDGLSFINFRAGKPSDIRFKSGGSMSETGYWKNLVSRPRYLTVNGA